MAVDTYMYIPGPGIGVVFMDTKKVRLRLFGARIRHPDRRVRVYRLERKIVS